MYQTVILIQHLILDCHCYILAQYNYIYVYIFYNYRCKLLAYKAKQFGYKHVFLGETSTRLAVNILANLAQGRGAHLASDTRFTDEGRYFGINLLRPMRDISAKEIVVYNNLHKVCSLFLCFEVIYMYSSNLSRTLTWRLCISLHAIAMSKVLKCLKFYSLCPQDQIRSVLPKAWVAN